MTLRIVLPELQRCAVILKDVLGHSVDEIASTAGCSQAAAKSALQRGRSALRQLAQAPEDTRFALGAIEGQPAMLVFDSTGPMQRPAHFILIDSSEERITAIRDFLFAPYVLEAIDWVRLG